MLNARAKGRLGEQEVIAYLQPVVNEAYREAGLEPPELVRNLSQSRAGGFDVSGLDWLALEVKRQESDQVSQWWQQCKRQAGESCVAVLVYRKSRTPWRVRMFGYVDAGASRIRCPVDISMDAFLAYLHVRIIWELASKA